LPESLISLGVWAVGFLMVALFYKIALSVEFSAVPALDREAVGAELP
jgi:hypothetical protein